MTARFPHWKAYLALLTVYLIWGTTMGSMRIGVESLPWAVLPCCRFLLSGLLLVGFCLLRGERIPSLQNLKKHALAGLILFTGGNSIVCWAVQHIPTSLGGLMVATTPFWMIWLSSVMPPKEKVSPIAIGGILIGFIGMLILLSPQLTQPSHTPPIFWWSVLAMLVNTFFWAFGSIVVRKNPSSDSLFMTVGLQNLAGGLVLIPVCLLTVPDWNAIQVSIHTTWALTYLVVMGTMIATPCYLYVLRALPVSVSSTFAYVTPVLTVFFGWLFLKETLTPLTLIGMGVILTGVIVVQWVNQHQLSRQNEKKRAMPALSESLPLKTVYSAPNAMRFE